MNQGEIKNKYWVLLFALMLLTIFVWVFVIENTNSGELSVSFLNIGQGDAIFIETPHKNQILIDGGPPNGKVLRELRKQMPFYDRFIDVVIATHPDIDHIGGLVGVLSRFNIGVVLDSGLPSKTSAYIQKEKIISEKNIKNIFARRGMKLILDDGIVMDILFPDRDLGNVDSNTNSIVVRLTYGDTEFLFSGDSPQKIEKYVVSLDGENLLSDVLKLGHHGSKTSSSEEFLSAVNPQYTIVSAGVDNKYGHPHPDVVKRAQGIGAEVLSTQNLGTITFITDGRTLKIK